jgi:hypothetical protein
MAQAHYWWTGLTAERYWCEITDRDNPGDDLLCPQTQKGGKPYWSYSLILQIQPGDIVFHYFTPEKSFIGASVAVATAANDEMLWVSHGGGGNRLLKDRMRRPAWRLPIRGFLRMPNPLTLAEVQNDDSWVREWIAEKKRRSRVVACPIQPYPAKLRGYQGYLTKMPFAFVNRWPKLRVLSAQLSRGSYVQDLSLELNDDAAVLTAVNEDLRQKARQGFCVSPRARRAIEEFAVLRAKSHYEALGYKVEVLGRPYDLRCTNSDGLLHVEVKGTTTSGDEILLTPNEITFANEHPSSMALFIVSGIRVTEGEQPVASGGIEVEIKPWKIEREHLTAVGYSYVVPRQANTPTSPCSLAAASQFEGSN